MHLSRSQEYFLSLPHHAPDFSTMDGETYISMLYLPTHNGRTIFNPVHHTGLGRLLGQGLNRLSTSAQIEG